MEKKKCPQCKNLILKTSPTCLYCGRPNKFITKEYVNKKWNKDNKKYAFDYIYINKYLVFVLFLIFKIGIVYFFKFKTDKLYVSPMLILVDCTLPNGDHMYPIDVFK